MGQNRENKKADNSKEARLSNYIDRNKNIVEYLYNRDESLREAKSGSSIYTYEYTKNLNLKSKSINGKQFLEYKHNKNDNIIELTDVLGQPSK